MASDEHVRPDPAEPPPLAPLAPPSPDASLPPPRPACAFGWALLIASPSSRARREYLLGLMALIAMIIVDPGLLMRLRDAGPQGAEALLGPGVLGFSMFCQETTAVLSALGALRLVVGREWRRHIAFVPPRASHVVLAILAMPGMLVLENLVHQGASHVLPGFHYQESVERYIRGFPTGLALVLFALGPGIAEELMFRGFLGRGLVARHGLGVGVLLTSLLFGLVHLDPPHVVATALWELLPTLPPDGRSCCRADAPLERPGGAGGESAAGHGGGHELWAIGVGAAGCGGPRCTTRLQVWRTRGVAARAFAWSIRRARRG